MDGRISVLSCLLLSGMAISAVAQTATPSTQTASPTPQTATPAGQTASPTPQTATPQGALPFQHDHTVTDTNSTKLRGFLVFCSEAGIASGSCETATPNFPLARRVNGQPLKSAEAIESAANSGLVTLLDTGATFIATITSN